MTPLLDRLTLSEGRACLIEESMKNRIIPVKKNKFKELLLIKPLKLQCFIIKKSGKRIEWKNAKEVPIRLEIYRM